MYYWGAEKPIHEVKLVELCGYAFCDIWENLEYVFTCKELSQKEVDKIIDFVSTIVKTLTDALKKSLIYFYPQRSKDILELKVISSSNFRHLSLYPEHGSLTIIRKGIDALESLEKFSRSYYIIHGEMIARMNPCDHEKLPLSNEVLKRKKDDFEKMKSALESYCLHSKEPLVKRGKQREAQLRAPRDKKNKALKKYCSELMQANPASSSASLFRRIPKKEKAAIIDGFTIYRENTEEDGEKIFCISPTGKQTPVGERAFADYFKDVKKV